MWGRSRALCTPGDRGARAGHPASCCLPQAFHVEGRAGQATVAGSIQARCGTSRGPWGRNRKALCGLPLGSRWPGRGHRGTSISQPSSVHVRDGPASLDETPVYCGRLRTQGGVVRKGDCGMDGEHSGLATSCSVLGGPSPCPPLHLLAANAGAKQLVEPGFTPCTEPARAQRDPLPLRRCWVGFLGGLGQQCPDSDPPGGYGTLTHGPVEGPQGGTGRDLRSGPLCAGWLSWPLWWLLPCTRWASFRAEGCGWPRPWCPLLLACGCRDLGESLRQRPEH